MIARWYPRLELEKIQQGEQHALVIRMWPAPDGPYVLCQDHEAELTRLREENERLKAALAAERERWRLVEEAWKEAKASPFIGLKVQTIVNAVEKAIEGQK